MTIDEFKALRDLPDKVVTSDLIFTPTTNPTVFRSQLRVNVLGLEIILDATYYDLNPSVVFNFRVIGNGAISRYCINHTPHKDFMTNIQSRTHKHKAKTDRCFNNNL